jgi:hypothetical protein
VLVLVLDPQGVGRASLSERAVLGPAFSNFGLWTLDIRLIIAFPLYHEAMISSNKPFVTDHQIRVKPLPINAK